MGLGAFPAAARRRREPLCSDWPFLVWGPLPSAAGNILGPPLITWGSPPLLPNLVRAPWG